jgi:magnesium-transporting ATPase (P-type)
MYILLLSALLSLFLRSAVFAFVYLYFSVRLGTFSAILIELFVARYKKHMNLKRLEAKAQQNFQTFQMTRIKVMGTWIH